MSRQCVDNTADRALGEAWERAFCVLAAKHGLVFSPHQIGRPGKSASAYGPGANGSGYSRYLLPDVTVWSAPGQHHEIKHKNPTKDGCYGLEKYRLDALVRWAETTAQNVYYTIHDWELAGAASSAVETPNLIEHWRYASVADLSVGCTKVDERGRSWVNGTAENEVLIWYWTSHKYFRPLADLWLPTRAAA